MKKIILDSTVNKYNLYPPAKFVSKFETPTYDQIDLVDLLIEKIIAFRYMNYSTLNSSNP
jgi:hypothetical protein